MPFNLSCQHGMCIDGLGVIIALLAREHIYYMAFCTVFLAFSSIWAFTNGMFVTKSTLLHCIIHVLKSLYLIVICILMSFKMHSQNWTVSYLFNILSFFFLCPYRNGIEKQTYLTITYCPLKINGLKNNQQGSCLLFLDIIYKVKTPLNSYCLSYSKSSFTSLFTAAWHPNLGQLSRETVYG